MFHIQVNYRIRSGHLAEAEEKIAAFVESLRGGRKLFESYQIFRQAGDPTAYVHLISYPNHEAQLAHTLLPHVKNFVDKMAGLCESGPAYTELENLLEIG